MSQHTLNNFTAQGGQVVDIRFGWDRRLGHYFLDVEDQRWDEECEKDEDDQAQDMLLYDSLSETSGGLDSHEQVMAVLSQLGIVLPAHIYADMLYDSVRNVGNKITNWNEPAQSTMIGGFGFGSPLQPAPFC